MPKALGGGWARPVEAKTAAYTVTASDCGKFFTNRGAAGSVTFTLPPANAAMGGFWCEFATAAAQAIVVSKATSLIVHANAGATSVTTAATIGQHLTATCDGTGWFVTVDPSAASAATAVTAVTIA